MKQHGVQKMVVVSSMGAGSSSKFVKGFVKWMLKYPLADKTVQETLVSSNQIFRQA